MHHVIPVIDIALAGAASGFFPWVVMLGVYCFWKDHV
jgi:hypothetical protein